MRDLHELLIIVLAILDVIRAIINALIGLSGLSK